MATAKACRKTLCWPGAGPARAKGYKDAAASLENVHQRAFRKADIARYVGAFDGADLILAKFAA